jgi:hypothetical protein
MTPTVHTRAATADDLPAIGRLHVASWRVAYGDAEQVPADARAPVRDGLQGANHSHSPSDGEDLQRRRPPEAGMRAPRGTCSALPYAGIVSASDLAALQEAQRADDWRRALNEGRCTLRVALLDGPIAAFSAHGPRRDAGAAADEGEIGSLYAAAGFERVPASEQSFEIAGQPVEEVRLQRVLPPPLQA